MDIMQRLSEATEGSRELDAEIAKAIDLRHWGQPTANIPHYSTSIDAALTMLAPETFWGVEGPQSDGMYEAEISAGPWQSIERAATPALALCGAAVNTLNQQGETP